MARVVKPYMSDRREARALLRKIFINEANIEPDEERGTLTVWLHHLANPVSDRIVRRLCADLNATKTRIPGTDLRLVYNLVSD